MVIYAADVGSLAANRFAYWRLDGSAGRGGERPAELAVALFDDVDAGRAVSLGFECPLSIPLVESEDDLGRARVGEGSRPWSAGAGPPITVLGIQQLTWVLRQARRRLRRPPVATVRWQRLLNSEADLHLWEAFVSRRGVRGDDRHMVDASDAANAFAERVASLALGEEPPSDLAVDDPINLAAMAAERAGFSAAAGELHQAPTVVRPL